jgi:hypothetical protein
LTIQSPASKNAATVDDANLTSADNEKRATRQPRRIREWLLSLYRRWPGIIASGSLAVLLAAAYLLAAPMGRDLSAQMSHAQLAEW